MTEDRIPLENLPVDAAPAEVSEVDLYQRREKIYTRKIEGFFQKVRLYTGWPILVAYFSIPWMSWGGEPLVHFDIPARQFHILTMTFWPQDFRFLAWFLMIAAFGLFFITSLAGRVWCGYTCPQTVWTAIFMWIEQKTEGSRNQRIKLDQAPWSANKFFRKYLKHSMWVTVAFATGFTFIGYFIPAPELVWQIIRLDLHPWAMFWIGFFTWTTYINAGWLREQVCMYMCPYARFQSVMFDKDTLIVSYDSQRGEPRGSRKRDAARGEQGLGDCVDCELCVQVCPTGIDIRNGLQYQCITCALCIDACNSVMDKMHYPRGLIRYTTEHQLDGEEHHWLRLKPVGYAIGILAMSSLLVYSLATRSPIGFDVIRDRNQLFIKTDSGSVQNVYTLRIMNMDRTSHRFTVTVNGIEATVLADLPITLDAGEVRDLPVRLEAGADSIQGSRPFEFQLQATDNGSLQKTRESRFIGPM